MRSPLLLAVVALAALSCGRSPTEPRTIPVPPEVRAAPASAALAGQTLTIETSLWRDFMPGPDMSRDGRPLIAAVRVHTTDGAPIDPGVVGETIWVVYGDRAWAAAAVEEQPRNTTVPDLVLVARDGPKWGPGARVDVTVRLRNAAGQTILLRAPGQLIYRTE